MMWNSLGQIRLGLFKELGGIDLREFIWDIDPWEQAYRVIRAQPQAYKKRNEKVYDWSLRTLGTKATWAPDCRTTIEFRKPLIIATVPRKDVYQKGCGWIPTFIAPATRVCQNYIYNTIPGF